MAIKNAKLQVRKKPVGSLDWLSSFPAFNRLGYGFDEWFFYF
jgi:hypothetical protein